MQYAPSLLSHLLSIVDDPKDARRFILTGSQNILLSKHVSQSLAGRVGLLELYPLSLLELRNAKKLAGKQAEELMFNGCYPCVHAEGIDAQRFARGYEKTYIERDVRTIGGVGDLLTFQRFLRLSAGRVGQLLNLSSLGSDAGVSQTTAKSWMSILRESFVIFLLQPHHSNFSKRIIRSPKLYFSDTGLLCMLLRITSEDELKHHALRGSIFENLVLTEYVKHYANRGMDPFISFWRDHTGHEIDLILEQDKTLFPIEIKSGYSLPSDALKNLAYWTALKGNRNKESAVIYCGDRSEKRGNTRIVPWNGDFPVV